MKRIFKQFNLIKTNNLSPLIIEHKKKPSSYQQFNQ